MLGCFPRTLEMPRPTRRTSYLLSIWTEFPAGAGPLSRGYLETATGQRLYFTTLAQFNALLCELSGTADPPVPAAPSAPTPHTDAPPPAKRSRTRSTKR